MIQPNRWARLPQSAAMVIALLVALLPATVAMAQPPTPRIVGGQEADPGEWPWQVALVKKGSDLYNNQFCGGMIIAANWVVTAAHCVDTEGPNDLDVVAGVHDLGNPGANIQRRTLSQIIVHPNYNPGNGDSDVALLRLASPIAERPASAGTLPIRYITLVPTNVGDLAGRDVTVTGWGNRKPAPPGGIDYPQRLHEVVVPVATQAACVAAYAHLTGITANMLCAGQLGSGKDSCQGDSGGPLVYNNNGTWQLAGIVSWGEGCAHPNYYGVYVRVSRFVDWINSYTAPPINVTNAIYLPVALNPSAGPTPPPPPPPPPPNNPIANGNFEGGPGVGWDELSLYGVDLIVSEAPAPAHSGEWLAWLGGLRDEASILSQYVAIPTAAPILSFYHWIDSADECGKDLASIHIATDMVWSADLCTDTHMSGWERQVVDLSAYAGRGTVQLDFIVITSLNIHSSWFLDDVALVPSAAAAGE